MPKMVYGATSGITVPAGRYLAEFVGTEDAEPMKDSRYGNADQPRMAWVFQVVDGPKKGERFAQETGTKATPRSTCARIITGLSGGTLAVGQTVNTDQFVGRTYEIKIAPNPNSDKGNLHISDIEPRGGTAGSPAAASAATGAAPPPRRPQPTRPAGVLDPKQKYWIDTGGSDEVQGDTEAVAAYLRDNKLSAADLMLCPVGGNDWKPAKDFGFAGA